MPFVLCQGLALSKLPQSCSRAVFYWEFLPGITWPRQLPAGPIVLQVVNADTWSVPEHMCTSGLSYLKGPA